MTRKLTEPAFLGHRVTRPIYVYLMSGIKLQGKLESEDADAIFLRPHGGREVDVQMIYKWAISTIMLAPTGDRLDSSDEEMKSVLRRARHARRAIQPTSPDSAQA